MNSRRLLGVNLQTDVFDLMNGDAGLGLMLRDQQKSDAMSYSMPIEAAVLLDSSDANKLMGSFDKVMQGFSALSPDSGVKQQSLSGLPYSVVMVDDKPVITYGVVDGRFVMGTDSNTLLGIDNAEQASLANDATFKQATGLLPGNRLNTAYLNFQPLWNLIDAQVKGSTRHQHRGWRCAELPESFQVGVYRCGGSGQRSLTRLVAYRSGAVSG